MIQRKTMINEKGNWNASGKSYMAELEPREQKLRKSAPTTMAQCRKPSGVYTGDGETGSGGGGSVTGGGSSSEDVVGGEGDSRVGVDAGGEDDIGNGNGNGNGVWVGEGGGVSMQCCNLW